MMAVDEQALREGASTLRVVNADARGRILETAYDLFSRYGTRPVGVDTIVAQAGVAKTTCYRRGASLQIQCRARTTARVARAIAAIAPTATQK